MTLFAYRLRINGDRLLVRIDAGAEFLDHLPVHRDTAGGNQIIAMAPRTDACVSEDFVETFHEQSDLLQKLARSSTLPAMSAGTHKSHAPGNNPQIAAPAARM